MEAAILRIPEITMRTQRQDMIAEDSTMISMYQRLSHVDQVASPCGVDSTGPSEDVVLDFVEPRTSIDAADRRLLAEGDHVGPDPLMLQNHGLP